MRANPLLLTCFAFLTASSSVRAQVAGYPTDLELIQRALEEAVGKVVDGLPAIEPSRVLLKEEGESEGGWMVEKALARQLKRGGWEVALADAAARLDAGGLVSYRVINLGVVYGKRHRKGVLGKSLVERRARAELSILLTRQPAGDVLWVEQVTGEATDEVPEDQLEILKANSFTLNPEELKEESRSLLEPLIVTALVGVLIYLFYSTKSNQ